MLAALFCCILFDYHTQTSYSANVNVHLTTGALGLTLLTHVREGALLKRLVAVLSISVRPISAAHDEG